MEPKDSEGRFITLSDLAEYDVPVREPDRPKYRYSITKIAIGLVILALIGSLIYKITKTSIQNLAPTNPTFSAPYVDATLTPTYNFQVPSNNPTGQVVLGFVVAGSNSCEPSWGGYYTLNQANTTLDMQRRIKEVANTGGSTMISFGGLNGPDLFAKCTNIADLVAAYQSVISTYSVRAIDFDIEGAALADSAGIARNAAAIDALERTNPNLNVWITLPVALSGLTPQGEAVVRSLIVNHDKFAGINVMAFDFGTPIQNMVGAVEGTLESVHGQLTTIFAANHLPSGSRSVWNKIGATLMIGQNDSSGERLSVEDAQTLDQFFANVRVRRVSFWSLNRDVSCTQSVSGAAILSSYCSGVTEQPLQFSTVFSNFNSSIVPSKSPNTLIIQNNHGITSASNAPYPIWTSYGEYPQGYKVVWQGNIYEANYFTGGVAPSNTQGAQTSTDAWTIIGPVLQTDKAPVIPRLPSGTYPNWSPTQVYQSGDHVEVDGLGYVARYSNSGSNPSATIANSTQSPWIPLFQIPGEPTTAN